jgi:hypothetical protein
MIDLNVPIEISAECARLVFVAVFGAEPDGDCDENLEYEGEAHAWASDDSSPRAILIQRTGDDAEYVEVVATALNRKSKSKFFTFAVDSESNVADAVDNLKAQIGSAQ